MVEAGRTRCIGFDKSALEDRPAFSVPPGTTQRAMNVAQTDSGGIAGQAPPALAPGARVDQTAHAQAAQRPAHDDRIGADTHGQALRANDAVDVGRDQRERLRRRHKGWHPPELCNHRSYRLPASRLPSAY